MMNTAWYFLLSVLLLLSCITPDNPHSKLAPGLWKGTLEVDSRSIDRTTREPTLESIGNLKMESVTEGLLPFHFEVSYVTDDSFYIELINGSERIKVTDIGYGRDRRTAYDTIRINFPMYDTYLHASINGGVMEGFWHVNYKKNPDGSRYRIPFIAEYGKKDRFSALPDPSLASVAGRWEVSFLDNPPYPAIGEFEKNGDIITGTFLTETGDYRFLEGTQSGNKIYLSCFDGSHAFLFEAKLTAQDSLIGIFRSGKHYKTGWTAQRNTEAQLTSPDKLTTANSDDNILKLNMPSINGESISLDDSKYAGKIKLIKIMGTWCPNCRDESRFLKEWINNNPSEDIAIIAVAFEKYRDHQKALTALNRYKEKMVIPWDIALGGYADKAEASTVFPQLSKIISFPTLIFLDADNKIRRVHTGFNGPATSKYRAFTESFNKTISELREEIN